MNALESGSVEQDIALFSIFLGRLVSESAVERAKSLGIL